MNYYALVYYLKNYPDFIENLRRKYDPMVNIIKPHLTIVFPIPESDINEQDLINHMQIKINKISSFSLQFNGLERSWDNYLFLITKTGTENMKKLHDELYVGILEPFLRKDIAFSPHITLGVFQDSPERYVLAEKEAEEQNISFEEKVSVVNLIKGSGILPPKTIQKFSLH